MEEKLLNVLERELTEGERICDVDINMDNLSVRAIIITPYHNARRVVYYYNEFSGDIERLNDACGFMDIVR